jgi:hypothetical protein
MEEKNAKEIPEKPTSAILPAPKKDKKSETTGQDTPEVDSRSSLTDSEVKLEGDLSTTVTDKPQSDGDELQKAIALSLSVTDHDRVKLEGAAALTTTDKPRCDDVDTLQATIVSVTDTDHTDGGAKLEGATALSARDEPRCDDNKELVDQIKGVLYGNCIGDAIGLLTEFMDKNEAQKVRCCFICFLFSFWPVV